MTIDFHKTFVLDSQVRYVPLSVGRSFRWDDCTSFRKDLWERRSQHIRIQVKMNESEFFCKHDRLVNKEEGSNADLTYS